MMKVKHLKQRNRNEISNKVVFTLLAITILISVIGFFLVIDSLENVGLQAQVVSGQRDGVIHLTIDTPPAAMPNQAGTGRVVLNIVNVNETANSR